MVKNHIAQCGSKSLVLIDSFELDDKTPISVYVFDRKKSIKQYCYDSGLLFKVAYENIYSDY